jgi:hypothetical protein
MPKTPANQVFRFTSVLTARNGTMRYFRSPDEVPRELQREVDKALKGDLTANIILADEGGQKYLKTREEPKPPVASRHDWRQLMIRRLLLEAVGAFAVAAMIWMLADTR